jgi:hypothetical protein
MRQSRGPSGTISRRGSSFHGRIALTLAACVLAAPTAMNLPAAASAPSSAASLDELASVVQTPFGPRLNELADQIDQFGRAKYPVVYGGVYEVDNATKIAVYLTSLDESTEAAFARLAPAGIVTFAETRRSLASLELIHETVLQHAMDFQKQGIDLVDFWPDIQSGQEILRIVGLTNWESTKVLSTIDLDGMRLEGASHGVAATASRDNDTSPYNGGDAIATHNPESGCSSGFGISVGSDKKLLTAGHCSPVGAVVTNDHCEFPNDVETCDIGSDANMGTIERRSAGQNSLDTELIDVGQSSDLIWRGQTTPISATVYGYTNNPGGSYVCNSGAYSYEVCNIQVQSGNHCIYLLYNEGTNPPVYYYSCHQTYGLNPAGNVANQEGDSGGPIYRFVGGILYATGTVSAQFGPDGTEVDCVYFTAHNHCSDDIYFLPISVSLQEWGATLNTP